MRQYVARRQAGAAEPEAEFLAAHDELREDLALLLQGQSGARSTLDDLIVSDARALPIDERDAFLDRVCDGDLARRNELDQRLTRDAMLEDPHPERVGDYEILDVLGTGGMGTVYLAQQTGPLHRRVAVKLMKPGIAGRDYLARFQRERQALARLAHPGVAKVLEAGNTAEHRPYFVMEFVDGEPISKWCDRHRVAIHDRLELFLQVCEAVQHAHQNGIIHRDLKPSNILVGGEPGHPHATVIDFGLAKAFGQPLVDGATFTEIGQFLGTPGYLSPEQARVGADGVDTRTDVYSLGVVLYELLTGVLPFELAPGVRGDPFELRRVMVESEPTRPSTRLNRLGGAADEAARRRGLESSRALLRRLRGDLDWITTTATAPERERRYSTVAELAADVRRHLAHEPIAAGPPSKRYLMGKFVRRHRGAVAAATTIVLLLVGGLIAVSVYAAEANRNLALFDLLAKGDELDALLAQESHARWPARPESVALLTEWTAAVRRRVGEVDELRAEQRRLDTDRATSFARPRFKVLRDFLAAFIPRLESLGGTDGVLADAQRRLDWANELQRRANDGARRRAWQEACAAIAASPEYGGLVIREQVGLLPLGANPHTRLWEFACQLPGAEVPQPGADGWNIVGDRTTVVLVLLPGGRFDMGADAPAESTPMKRGVALDAFFFGKHEISQGQWRLLTGKNPSAYRPDAEAMAITLANPVECVDWSSADGVLARWGLTLPTEAQWEYAARAGTTTNWWTGDEAASIGAKAAGNLFDQSALKVLERAKLEQGRPVPWDDGHVVHAPVDALAPNPWGLYGIIGNVVEWCRDDYQYYQNAQPRLGDGLLLPLDPNWRPTGRHPCRGGYWKAPATQATSAYRFGNPAASAPPAIGLRAARPIEP
ncbi:MAG: bifunctional serine/threonine-protein kinase/formylglycine-generating enzyme family protein [Planctomycetota bacterium]